MINIQRDQIVLSRMVKLLRIGDLNDWALALESFEKEMENSPDTIAAKILSTFGGMGSLNDIVLYNSGQILIAENGEFDELRSKLYNICHE